MDGENRRPIDLTLPSATLDALSPCRFALSRQCSRVALSFQKSFVAVPSSTALTAAGSGEKVTGESSGDATNEEGTATAALALLPSEAMAEDLIRIGLFNRDAAIIVAEGKDFLRRENIRVEINTVTDSPTLLRNLISGKYDLILNNADNVIAWAEGQGEDPQKNDFVIFLGGSQGVNQKLIVAAGIKDFSDLKGKIFAVDAPTTGYAIVGVYILK